MGSMGVQEDGKEAMTLKPGDTLLIKPGTVHRHWNMSRAGKQQRYPERTGFPLPNERQCGRETWVALAPPAA
jgi:hypothetical protein